MNITFVQPKIERLEKHKNLEHITQLLATHTIGDLVLLPELFTRRFPVISLSDGMLTCVKAELLSRCRF